MESARKAYFVEFGSAMVGYVIVLPIAMSVIQRFPDAPWRYAVALAPVVPLCFALAAMLRFFNRSDEMIRRVHFDAFAVSAGATAIATFAYGMLQNVGLPPINLTLVAPFTIAVWGIASCIAWWRYR